MTSSRPSSPSTRPGRTALVLTEGVERQRTADGVLRLVGPLLRPSPIMRPFAWLLRVPPRHQVELDTIGTWVVERLDGRCLEELASDLAGHLKLTRREAETALAEFTRLLAKRRLAHLVPVAA